MARKRFSSVDGSRFSGSFCNIQSLPTPRCLPTSRAAFIILRAQSPLTAVGVIKSSFRGVGEEPAGDVTENTPNNMKAKNMSAVLYGYET
jgi:hypothetical protein